MKKKKYFSSPEDKKDWIAFTKQIGNIHPKEVDFLRQDIKTSEIQKLDLHGFSLNDANHLVKKFIIQSFEQGYRKLFFIK